MKADKVRPPSPGPKGCLCKDGYPCSQVGKPCEGYKNLGLGLNNPYDKNG